jgi:hypothetical protein
MVDQMRGALRHSAAAATGAQGAAFARKRDQPVQAAVATAESGESAGEPATPQEVPEGKLDEARQAFPVTQAGRLRAKGLEVVAYDLVQRALRG